MNPTGQEGKLVIRHNVFTPKGSKWVIVLTVCNITVEEAEEHIKVFKVDNRAIVTRLVCLFEPNPIQLN
jgi:hypothetical protein